MKKTLITLCAIGVSFALISCSTPTDVVDSDEPSTSHGIELPEAIQKSGVLRIATDPSIPPCTFLPAGATEPQGVDIDIMEAVGDYLGLEVVWEKMKFEGLITSVESGRVDATAGCMSDYTDREERATFIDYAYALIGFTVDSTNPANIVEEDPLSLCGTTIALQTGSSSPNHLNQYTAYCTDNGGKAIVQQSFPSAAEALLSLSSGRVDAFITSYGAGAYQELETKGKVKVVAPPVIPDSYYVAAQPKVYIGVAVSKDDKVLQDAILAAVQHVRTTGDFYDNVMKKWNVKSFSLDEVGINLHTTRPLVKTEG